MIPASSGVSDLSMPLNALLAGFVQSTDAMNPVIFGMTVDSRQVKEGDLFFACQGISTQGSLYIDNAISAGAIAVLIETDSAEDIRYWCRKYPEVVIRGLIDLSKKLGFIAARFYAEPSTHLSLIGITGTNGKTSCAHLLAQCLGDEKHVCGVIGTLGAGSFGNGELRNGPLRNGELNPIQNTTPGAVELQQILHAMKQKNATYVAMEVSSHGLEQGRVNACQFDVAVFTNLTRDHLDYHGDMKSYANSKLKLFLRPELRKIVVNLDDPYSHVILDSLVNRSVKKLDIIGFSLAPNCDRELEGLKTIVATNISLNKQGLAFDVSTPWGAGRMQTHLLGDFNVSNILSVIAVALLHDVSFQELSERIKIARAPAGRLETFGVTGSPLVVVDYAHTPDALEKAMSTLQQYAKGRLYVLFGCGGDRDQGKRSEMGALAEKIADEVWLTDDNPRTERSENIIDDILKGFEKPQTVVVEMNRAIAIKNIISAANGKNDVVLIAGKGHEDYQIVGHERFKFSDRELVEKLVGKAA